MLAQLVKPLITSEYEGSIPSIPTGNKVQDERDAEPNC